MSQNSINPDWLQWPQTQSLIAAFGSHPGALRFVGGAVRDALLGCEVVEVDAATTLLPDVTMALLEKSGIRAIPTGIAHGTVTAVMGGKSFEVTTLRRDVATDGRHATVAFTDDWKVDASRRDFTMNAMYLSPRGELFDYFGGAEDAKAGRVRFIGDASQRISEDYLRILRFFRFHAHYGQGTPDVAAVEACSAQASAIATLSGERVQSELLKLLNAPMRACWQVLDIMRLKNILTPAINIDIFHDNGICNGLTLIEEKIDFSLPAEARLVMFMLEMGIAAEEALQQLTSRLKLSSATVGQLTAILRYVYDIHSTLTEAQQKRMIRKCGQPAFGYCVAVKWALDGEPVFKGHAYDIMLTRAQRWQPPEFPVSGDDLIARGVKPGKDMGELLRHMEEQWEASGYRVTKETLLAEIK